MINIRTSKKSPNYGKGRVNWNPDIIVCHTSEGYYESGCDWLCDPKSQSSTHFFVSKKGEVSQLVDIQDTAWGNGNTITSGDSRYYGNSLIQAVRDRKVSSNNYTVSIEHEGFYKDSMGALTEAQLNATAELIKHIIKEVKRIYNIDIPIDRQHIVGHCDIAPKWKPNCPGNKFPFDEIIKRLNDSKTPTPDYKVSESILSTMVNLGIINSPDYWRNITTIQYLETLLLNAAKPEICDKKINNGISNIEDAFTVLVDAGVISNPDYWRNIIKDSITYQYVDNLLINIANKCRIVLEKIVHAEAQGEGIEGQTLIANIIFNRNKDNSFPNGIFNIVCQQSIKNGKTIFQFSPVGDGAYSKAKPSESVKRAVTNALNGKDDSKGALYFCSKASASNSNSWHENALVFLFEHKNHRFYK